MRTEDAEWWSGKMISATTNGEFFGGIFRNEMIPLGATDDGDDNKF